MQAEVYYQKPPHFSSQEEVVVTFLTSGYELLLLEKQYEDGVFYWSVPGGKLEEAESPEKAVIRELKEEVGFDVSIPVQKFATCYVQRPDIAYTAHLFLVPCDKKPKVQISKEHTQFAWTPWLYLENKRLLMPLEDWMLRYFACALQGGCIRRPFYYMRHGQTDQNVQGRFVSGDTDIPLNAEGKRQSEVMQSKLQALPIQRVCYSPMQRAVQTMELATKGLSTERLCIKALKEKSKRPHRSMGFVDRVYMALNCCLSIEGVPLLIAHGDVFQAISHILNLPSEHHFLKNCQLVYVEPYGADGWKVKIL